MSLWTGGRTTRNGRGLGPSGESRTESPPRPLHGDQKGFLSASVKKDQIATLERDKTSPLEISQSPLGNFFKKSVPKSHLQHVFDRNARKRLLPVFRETIPTTMSRRTGGNFHFFWRCFFWHLSRKWKAARISIHGMPKRPSRDLRIFIDEKTLKKWTFCRQKVDKISKIGASEIFSFLATEMEHRAR